MSANIFGKIATAKGNSWHGLDLKVAPMTAEEAFRLSRQKELQIISGPVYNSRFEVVPDKVLLEAHIDNTYTPIEIHGKSYNVAPPQDLYRHFGPYVEALGGKYVTAGILGDFSKIWALAEVGGLGFHVGPDEVKSYFLSVIGYDGKVGFVAGTTNVVVVCQNTLSVALKQMGGLKVKNTKSRDIRIDAWMKENMPEAITAKEAEEGAEKLRKENAKWGNWFQGLAKVSANKQREEDFLKAIYPGETTYAENKRAELKVAIYEGPGAKPRIGTDWGLLNGLTYMETHAPALRGNKDTLAHDLFGAAQARRDAAYKFFGM